MVKYFFSLLCVLPFSTQAMDLEKLKQMSDNPELMRQQMEQLSKGFMEVTNCLGPETIEKIQTSAQKMQGEIASLCEKGDRSGAQKTAVRYSQEMLASSEYKKIKECGEKVRAHLPPGFIESIEGQQHNSDTQQASQSHICDNL